MGRFKVKYRLPGDQSRTREIIVDAITASDAEKVTKAQIPSAKIVGGPQQIYDR